MSVKASWFQIGLSGTANLNFHWRNLLDGVLRLTRGNAGAPIADVMLVKADNSVEFPGNIASGVLGAGQTWQDVKASRAKLVTYTNTTGRPIVVSIMAAGGGAPDIIFTLSVSGIVVGGYQTYAATSQGFVSAIVPPGATYILNADVSTIYYWAELR